MPFVVWSTLAGRPVARRAGRAVAPVAPEAPVALPDLTMITSTPALQPMPARSPTWNPAMLGELGPIVHVRSPCSLLCTVTEPSVRAVIVPFVVWSTLAVPVAPVAPEAPESPVRCRSSTSWPAGMLQPIRT